MDAISNTIFIYLEILPDQPALTYPVFPVLDPVLGILVQSGMTRLQGGKAKGILYGVALFTEASGEDCCTTL